MKTLLVVILMAQGTGGTISWHGIAAYFGSASACSNMATHNNQVSKLAFQKRPAAVAHLPTPVWTCYSEYEYIQKFGRYVG